MLCLINLLSLHLRTTVSGLQKARDGVAGGGGCGKLGTQQGQSRLDSVPRALGTWGHDEVCTFKDHLSFCMENILGQYINLLGVPWQNATNRTASNNRNGQHGAIVHHTVLHI